MEKIAERTTNQILSQDEKINFRLWLQRQFTERCKRNARYSLRAFAKHLDLDHSSLSQILSGKRAVSRNGVAVLCRKLAAAPEDMQAFGLISAPSTIDHDYLRMSADTFAIVSDWYHAAIMELTFTNGFKSDSKWIARKLSITPQEAKSAIERLLRLGLLREVNGTLVKSTRMLTNDDVNTNAARKEFQRQIIEKALTAVDECHLDEKDITSMTMAIDVKNLPKAREVIRKFRRDLCALLERGHQTQVYNLGIQLYPISKDQEKL